MRTLIKRDKSKPSKDYVDLIIKASIKTHLEGYHIYPEKSLHGDPLYPFIVNIDGQGILWEVEGEKEKTSVFVIKVKEDQKEEKG